MKTVILHGLGQTSHDWLDVINQASLPDVDCPELFSISKENISYPDILTGLEERYTNVTDPFCICGLSLGALLALDYTIRHGDKIALLILISAQYKAPTRLIDFQNLIFRFMPKKTFEGMGISKRDTIHLSHSMRSLDFSTRLNEIMCPVVLLCGEKDSANLKASKQLNELLPHAELHIISGAGHEINKYAPEAVATVLKHKQR